MLLLKFLCIAAARDNDGALGHFIFCLRHAFYLMLGVRSQLLIIPPDKMASLKYLFMLFS